MRRYRQCICFVISHVILIVKQLYFRKIRKLWSGMLLNDYRRNIIKNGSYLLCMICLGKCSISRVFLLVKIVLGIFFSIILHPTHT